MVCFELLGYQPEAYLAVGTGTYSADSSSFGLDRNSAEFGSVTEDLPDSLGLSGSVGTEEN